LDIRVSGPENRMEEIWREYSGEYQDALNTEWGESGSLKGEAREDG